MLYLQTHLQLPISQLFLWLWWSPGYSGHFWVFFFLPVFVVCKALNALFSLHFVHCVHMALVCSLFLLFFLIGAYIKYGEMLAWQRYTIKNVFICDEVFKALNMSNCFLDHPFTKNTHNIKNTTAVGTLPCGSQACGGHGCGISYFNFWKVATPHWLHSACT